jgi:protein gp37
MGDTSTIEWTDRTLNLAYGCDKVSPACGHCYIDRSFPYRTAGLKFVKGHIPIQIFPNRLAWPFKWPKVPSKVFIESLSDIFHEDIPWDFLDQVFATMVLTPHLTYQLLTKRPERMYAYFAEMGVLARILNAAIAIARERSLPLPDGLSFPISNLWLGVTVENEYWAHQRVPTLLQVPAVVHFLSMEPLLKRTKLSMDWLTGDPLHRVNWVILGGESGPKFRRFDPDWAREIAAQCGEAGTATFVKQLGGFRPGTRLEDLPEDLRIREFPLVAAA